MDQLPLTVFVGHLLHGWKTCAATGLKQKNSNVKNIQLSSLRTAMNLTQFISYTAFFFFVLAMKVRMTCKRKVLVSLKSALFSGKCRLFS